MRKDKQKIKKTKRKIITFCTIFILLWILIIYMYTSYQNIEIKTYDTSKSSATYEQTTVENVEKNSESIGDVVGNVSKCVVGISKFKDNKDFIFSNSIDKEMGLRYRNNS